MKTMESRSYAVLDSHQRMLDRQAVREANMEAERKAMDARRQRRSAQSIDDRVGLAADRLRSRNVPATIQLIETLSSRDRDVYLIAEEIGQNRKTVLQQFPKVRGSVRIAYFGKDKEAAPAAESDESLEVREEPTEEQTGEPKED